jgi:hypothetical protein
LQCKFNTKIKEDTVACTGIYGTGVKILYNTREDEQTN